MLQDPQPAVMHQMLLRTLGRRWRPQDALARECQVLPQLQQTFIDGEPPSEPTHILVVTDADLFYMLDEVSDGWDIARRAAEICGGGATAVLELPQRAHYKRQLKRLHDCGWETHIVTSMKEVVAFARAFARARYAGQEKHKR